MTSSVSFGMGLASVGCFVFPGRLPSVVMVWSYKQPARARPTVKLQCELDHESAVMCVDAGRDGKLIASGTKDGFIYFWDSETYIPVNQNPVHQGAVTAAQFSHDSKRFGSCGEDGIVIIVDVDTGTSVCTFKAEAALKCLWWDDQTVLAGGVDGYLYMWNLLSNKLLQKIKTHKGAVNCVTTGAGGVVATGGEDGRVVFWDTAQYVPAELE